MKTHCELRDKEEPGMRERDSTQRLLVSRPWASTCVYRSGGADKILRPLSSFQDKITLKNLGTLRQNSIQYIFIRPEARGGVCCSDCDDTGRKRVKFQRRGKS